MSKYPPKYDDMGPTNAAALMNSPGVSKPQKDTKGKPRVMNGCFLRFARAMKAVADLSEYGRIKYDLEFNDRAFMDVDNAYVEYTEALGRHLIAEELEGAYYWEKDHMLLHPVQAAWNALARLEVYLRNEERHVQPTAAPNTPTLRGEFYGDPLG